MIENVTLTALPVPELFIGRTGNFYMEKSLFVANVHRLRTIKPVSFQYK